MSIITALDASHTYEVGDTVHITRIISTGSSGTRIIFEAGVRPRHDHLAHDNVTRDYWGRGVVREAPTVSQDREEIILDEWGEDTGLARTVTVQERTGMIRVEMIDGPDASTLTAAVIAATRHLVGLSQAEFAPLVGVGRDSIKGWEAGKASPRAQAVSAILSLREQHDREVEAARAFATDGLPVSLGGDMPRGWYVAVAARLLDTHPDAALSWA